MKPFSEAEMNRLYGTGAAYDAKIDAHLHEMVRQRWIEARDIPLMKLRGTSEALYLGFHEAKA